MTTKTTQKDVENSTTTPVEDSKSEYMKYRDENLRLIRCKITNLNPANVGIQGRIYTVGNTKLGVVSKYIPFSGEAAESYHVPYILYKALKRRTYTQIKDQKNEKGFLIQKAVELPEFSITELPPLTKEELAELAKRQALNKSID